MSDTIDYYFTSPSPFAFMGLKQLADIAERHGKKIAYKPFNLLGVWENSGAVMPAERPPVRQRYRLIELQRVGSLRGLSIKPKPTNFPANPVPADHATLAIIASGADPMAFTYAVGEALWVNDRNIGDEKVIHEILSETGFNADAIMVQARGDDMAAARAKNTADAVANDAVGAPAYVYRGEVFWGQDRLDHLDAMIASGRDAFSSDI